MPSHKTCQVCGAAYVDNSTSQGKKTCSVSCRTSLWLRSKPGLRLWRLAQQRAVVLRQAGVDCDASAIHALLLSADHCPICGLRFNQNTRQMHVDHDHNTNRIRGVLCPRCNHLLAAATDPWVLRAAAEYLESHQ